MKRYLLAAAAVLISLPAFATTPVSAPTSAAAAANAAAVAGVVNDSFNTTNKIDASVKVDNSVKDSSIKNTATGGTAIAAGGAGGKGGEANQLQGQLQGQQQGQTAQGGAGGSAVSGSKSDQTQIQGLTDASVHTQTATVGDSVSGSSASSAGQSVSFYEEATKRAAASAYAAPLAIGGGVCAYTPASLALQLPGFGGSGSGARIDQGCETRATADMFARMGMSYEACLIMVSQPAAVRAGIKADACTPKPPIVVYRDAPAVAPPAPPIATEKDGEKG